MAVTRQVVARDLGLILRDLRELERLGRLDPMVTTMLKTMIRLVEILRRQINSMKGSDL